ncbi:hypothetical protein ACQKII_20150 [Lysinibacillus sp. NPDC048646]|uniref:hypothetical protein n=1 Tax=Lysinibacillus sp. NPDC048646 TaxID=3390574 RepID=UPI003D0326D5
MSKYGVEILKDLRESKKRVMTNVVQHIELRQNKKKSWRWQYSVLTIIFTACIGLFFYTQFNETNLVTSQEVDILNEDELTTMLKAHNVKSKESRNSVFQTLLEINAYYAYALSKGITLDKATIDEWVSKKDLEKDTNFHKTLAKLEITEDEFYEKYLTPINIKVGARNKLLQDYYKKYEDSFQLHAYLDVKTQAMDYFTSQYKEKIAYLEEKYQLSSNPTNADSFSKQYKFGQIVAVEGDRFLVVSGALEEEISHLPYTEIIEKKQNGVWFPLHGVEDKIAIGKQVNITYTMKDDTISQGYDFAANLDEIEMIE